MVFFYPSLHTPGPFVEELGKHGRKNNNKVIGTNDPG